MLGLFQVTHGPDQGRTFALPTEGKALLGRGGQNTISLSDPTVSRLHCQLTVEGTRVTLLDAGSISGTWVNGERITSRELLAGDVVRLGTTQLAFRWTDTDEKATDPWAD